MTTRVENEQIQTTVNPPPSSVLQNTGSSTSAERYHKMLAHIRSAAPPLLHKLQSGYSKLPIELIWTAHPHWPLPESSQNHNHHHSHPIRISVLDSSFNPPTLAHLALAGSPRPTYTTEPANTPYDAKLLLLSVKNVDKSLKPGDASYLQRLEMMALLAQDVQTYGGHNVAIAIVDEPTFVGKSTVLQEYLRTRVSSLRESSVELNTTSTSSQTQTQTQLTFIVGMDTLDRLFSPRYYPPPSTDPTTTAEQTMFSVLSRMLSPPSENGDDSLIVCAKRGTPPLPSHLTTPTTLEFAQKAGWMKTENDDSPSQPLDSNNGNDESLAIPKNERILLIDIGDRESKFSSTAVRNARARTGLGGFEPGGGPWKEWVTESVARHIEEEGLYAT